MTKITYILFAVILSACMTKEDILINKCEEQIRMLYSKVESIAFDKKQENVKNDIYINNTARRQAIYIEAYAKEAFKYKKQANDAKKQMQTYKYNWDKYVDAEFDYHHYDSLSNMYKNKEDSLIKIVKQINDTLQHKNVGTGFFFNTTTEKNDKYIYIITNSNGDIIHTEDIYSDHDANIRNIINHIIEN